ncbi:Oxidoreductase YdhF [compost metagenome]
MRPLAYAPLAEGRIAAGTDKQALKVREKLEELSAKYNANIESLAVAWLVKLGALPLIGTTNEQRIKNAANAFTIELDHQDWYELYNVSVEHQDSKG